MIFVKEYNFYEQQTNSENVWKRFEKCHENFRFFMLIYVTLQLYHDNYIKEKWRYVALMNDDELKMH